MKIKGFWLSLVILQIIFLNWFFVLFLIYSKYFNFISFNIILFIGVFGIIINIHNALNDK